MVYLEEEQWHTRTKQDYYLAAIATEVRNLFAKKGHSTTVEKMLLSFQEKGSAPVEDGVSMKQKFMGWLGVKGE